MNSMIYDPLEEYNGKFKDLHLEKTKKLFDDLTLQSGVNIEENRKTVKKYDDLLIKHKKLKKKLFLWRFLRVLCFITLILIPLVFLKLNSKIKSIRIEAEEAEKTLFELFEQAKGQLERLASLFRARDSIMLIESTIPQLKFEECFTAAQERNMILNYDFCEQNENDQTTLDVLAGHYNGNPFIFENKLTHRMGSEVYHGYKMITWREHYRDSKGKLRTRTRSETLHATVTKPKPFYSTENVLCYCAQGGPNLSFTRDATNLDEKSEKEIERYVKKGEKKLKKLTDEAIKENKDFVSMSNSDFEVLFDALDRTSEVEFRTLFTPLAQTNTVDLIRSQSGYGDDFHFFKSKRTNRIITEHSRGRELMLSPTAYISHSFDIMKKEFIEKNAEFFKAVYFDFAPLLAIPIYQESPMNSLNQLPEHPQNYAFKECEALLNGGAAEHLIHPETKTQAIIKLSFVKSNNGIDEMLASAYSYDIAERVDFVSVYGGDGRWHSVAVHWNEYIPLSSRERIFIASKEMAKNKNVLAERNNICIFTKKGEE